MILQLRSEDLGWERAAKILAGGSLRGSTAHGMSPEETQWRPVWLEQGAQGREERKEIGGQMPDHAGLED